MKIQHKAHGAKVRLIILGQHNKQLMPTKFNLFFIVIHNKHLSCLLYWVLNKLEMYFNLHVLTSSSKWLVTYPRLSNLLGM